MLDTAPDDADPLASALPVLDSGLDNSLDRSLSRLAA